MTREIGLDVIKFHGDEYPPLLLVMTDDDVPVSVAYHDGGPVAGFQANCLTSLSVAPGDTEVRLDLTVAEVTHTVIARWDVPPPPVPIPKRGRKRKGASG
jgi:hypothetical protein